MKKKYTRAPISEVFIGVCYKYPKINVDNLLKSALLHEEFPILEIDKPLTIEFLEGFTLVPVFNANGGPILVRRWTTDKKWLVQIQTNMIYVNWIRPDTEPVGHYVGFTAVKDKFFSILSFLEEHLGVSLQEGIAFCDLSYHDRFPWQDEISELSQLDRLMNISTPPKFSEHGYNNNFSYFTFHDFEIHGFGIISINTTTAIDGKQLIRVETSLRGCPLNSIGEWLSVARAKQFDIFEKLFKEKKKKKWE
jgi:uncharacterized protein (TIGR04255 family)